MAKKQDKRKDAFVPADAPKAPNARSRVPITEAQRESFLQILRETGVAAWAARQAGRSKSGFDALRRRDPEFARLCDDAIEEANGNIEAEAWRRATQGVDRYEVSGGQVVTHPETGEPLVRKEYSDSLMHTMLKARIQSYATKQYHEVKHQHAHVGAVLTHEDVALLPEARQEQLMDLLSEIEQAKSGQKQLASPDVEDADFTEGEDDTDAELAEIL